MAIDATKVTNGDAMPALFTNHVGQQSLASIASISLANPSPVLGFACCRLGTTNHKFVATPTKYVGPSVAKNAPSG